MWGRISALADAVEGRAGCATRPPRSLRTFPVSRASRPCLLAENTAETAVIRINSQAPSRTLRKSPQISKLGRPEQRLAETCPGRGLGAVRLYHFVLRRFGGVNDFIGIDRLRFLRR